MAAKPNGYWYLSKGLLFVVVDGEHWVERRYHPFRDGNMGLRSYNALPLFANVKPENLN